MPMAVMPPSASTMVTVASSMSETESQSTLRSGVRIRSARWPIAKAGCVPIPITLASCWR
jgi:hypothetical protein